MPFFITDISVESWQWQIHRKRRTGGTDKMKTVLIAASVAVFLVYGFVMYCCIKVGAESEKDYDRLTKGEGKENGG